MIKCENVKKLLGKSEIGKNGYKSVKMSENYFQILKKKKKSQKMN